MTNEHYMTKFWSNTHPMSEKGEKINDTYLMDYPVTNAPHGTKTKLKELQNLLHRHYRFYNDGDAFRYKGHYVGSSSRLGGMRGGRYYYNVEQDNKMLKIFEKDIANRIEELWVLTDGATK